MQMYPVCEDVIVRHVNDQIFLPHSRFFWLHSIHLLVQIQFTLNLPPINVLPLYTKIPNPPVLINNISLYISQHLSLSLLHGNTKGALSILQLKSHVSRDLGSQTNRRTLQQIQGNECQNGTQVQSEDGGNNSPEKVEVGISDLENGLKNGNSLCLGEPREEDTRGDDRVVDGDEVTESSNDNLFGQAVSGDGHGESVAAEGGASTVARDGTVELTLAVEHGVVGGGGMTEAGVSEGAGLGGSGEEDGGGCRGCQDGSEEEEGSHHFGCLKG